MPTIANINPYNNAAIFKKEVAFSTQDEITGQIITEGYNVNGPFHTTITAIPLAGGKKFVVPLTTDTGAGAAFLKFHFPNETSSNKMYVTFAVKNSVMADGYYDYTTGIPAPYKDKLKNFIVAPTSGNQLNLISGPREKSIRFTTYGSSTNKPAEAVTFYIKFTAVFTPITTQSAANQTFAPAQGAAPAGSGLAVGGGNISGFAQAIK
jgi:hypothetical protein